MECPKCGRKIPDDAAICPYCGFVLKKKELKWKRNLKVALGIIIFIFVVNMLTLIFVSLMYPVIIAQQLYMLLGAIDVVLLALVIFYTVRVLNFTYENAKRVLIFFSISAVFFGVYAFLYFAMFYVLRAGTAVLAMEEASLTFIIMAGLFAVAAHQLVSGILKNF